jgi:hypothetical protein
VLAWTAAKMIASEAFIAEALESRPTRAALLYIGVIGGVLGLAWLRNRRAQPAKQRMENIV